MSQVVGSIDGKNDREDFRSEKNGPTRGMVKSVGVWTLIFVIVFMFIGHVRPGFAQTEEDGLIVPISGAQGQSVQTDVLLGAWSWTAPATGPVTFDTRGTGFDTVLTISDSVTYVPIAWNVDFSDGTFSSDVRFTAQQGQTYTITAARADSFDFQPSTIVLNWLMASAASVLRFEVFETPESGKPNYVIAGDNASLQYWTTLNHGAARHGLGTTLSYVAAGTTDVLAEVEFLDYAMHNGRRVLVVFNDPPVPEDDPCHGMTHEYWDLETGNWVACLRDGELLGELTPHVGFFRFPMTVGDKWTQEMSWTNHAHPEHSNDAPFSQTYAVEECGIEVKVPAGEFTTCRVRFVEASYSNIVPETRWYDPDLDLVIKRDRDGVVYELWDYDLNTPPVRFSSALYTSADGTQSERVFYDEATGLPRQVLDEVSGNWMLIQQNGTFVDFWLYDRDGNYQDGFSVFEESGQYYHAEITGLPAHAGKKITGQLHPDAASWTGHFTLQIEWGDDLANIQPVPPEIAALMSSLATLATDQQEGAVPHSGRPQRAAIQGPVKRVALLRGMAALFTPGQVMAEEEEEGESTFSFSEALTLGGVTLIGMSVIGIVSPGAVVGGVVAIIGGEFLRNRAEQARSWCGEAEVEGDDVVARGKEFCHMAVNHLAYEDDRGAVGYLRDVLDWAMEKTDRLRAKIEQGKHVLENAVNQLTPDDPLYTESEDPLISDDTPPLIDSPMSGEAEGRDATVAEVTGDIVPDGSFTAVGEEAEIDGAIDEDGASVTGTFKWGEDGGLVSGSVIGDDELWWQQLNTEAAQAETKAEQMAAEAMEATIDSRLAGTEQPADLSEENTATLSGKEGSERHEGARLGSAHRFCLVRKNEEFQGLVHAKDATEGGTSNILSGNGETVCASLVLRPFKRITYDIFHSCASWVDPIRQASENKFCHGHPSEYPEWQNHNIYRFSCEDATLQHGVYGQLKGCTARNQRATWCAFEWPQGSCAGESLAD